MSKIAEMRFVSSGTINHLGQLNSLVLGTAVVSVTSTHSESVAIKLKGKKIEDNGSGHFEVKVNNTVIVSDVGISQAMELMVNFAFAKLLVKSPDGDVIALDQLPKGVLGDIMSNANMLTCER